MLFTKTSAAVIGKVKTISKLAPREKMMKPIDEAAICQTEKINGNRDEREDKPDDLAFGLWFL